MVKQGQKNSKINSTYATSRTDVSMMTPQHGPGMIKKNDPERVKAPVTKIKSQPLAALVNELAVGNTTTPKAEQFPRGVSGFTAMIRSSMLSPVD